MKIGDKVRFRLSEPDGNVIQGMGNIHYIDSEAIIPIQVELDNAKLLGQKLYRFYATEVELVENAEFEELLERKARAHLLICSEVEPIKEPEPEEQDPLVELKPPVNMVVRMVQKIPGYSFNPGDVFAASETSSSYNTCYYLYDPYSFELRGCMVKEAFELLYTDVSASVISKKAALMEFVKKSIEAPKKEIKQRKGKVKPEVKRPPKKPKTVFEVLESKGQMSIFDFEEVKA